MKRKRIGLFFAYNDNWIGGVYYIYNLIKATNCLNDDDKPIFYILTNSENDFSVLKKETNYPYLELLLYRNRNKFVHYFNLFVNVYLKISFSIQPKVFVPKDFEKLDLIFPSPFFGIKKISKTSIFWIPDFQEKHLPEMFSRGVIRSRTRLNNFISKKRNEYLVLSSVSALNDFKTFFPKSNINTFVLPFSVFHEKLSIEESKNYVREWISKGSYFYTPNQYWQHKNHLILIEAMNQLKKSGNLNFYLICSGKQHDPRNPSYFSELVKLINDYGLNDHVILLGFLDRNVQMSLIQNAKAIIQPSKFEGWSTVIEDAKALSKVVICSNLAVHHEQLGEKGIYFNPNDFIELSEILNNFTEVTVDIDYNYENQKKEYAKNIFNLFNGKTS